MEISPKFVHSMISGDDPKTVASLAKLAGIEGSEQYVDVSHVTQIHIVGQAVVVHSYPQTHKTYTHYYL